MPIDLVSDYVGASYDLYLGPPPVGANIPTYLTLQELMDAAVALYATVQRAVTVRVNPGTGYGDATVLADLAVAFEACGIETELPLPLPPAELGTVTIGDATHTPAVFLSQDHILLDALVLAVPDFALSCQDSVIGSITRHPGAPGLVGFGQSLFNASAFGPIDVDTMSVITGADNSFTTVKVRRIVNVTLVDLVMADTDIVPGVTTLPAWLTITDSFSGVSISGRWGPSSATGGAVVNLQLAGVLSGVDHEGLDIDMNMNQMGGGNWFFVTEEGGAVTPEKVAVRGVAPATNTTSFKGAAGAFNNSTFGPCAPDNLDWSGVTNPDPTKPNSFYTAGAVPISAGMVNGMMPVLDVIARPVSPASLNPTSAVPTTILGIVGMVLVPVPVPLHSISYNIAVAGVGAVGAVRLALYTDDGVLVAGTDVTDAPAAGVSGVRTVALPTPLMLPPGDYYQFVCIATDYGASNPTISTFTENTIFASVTDILSGTVVCVAGAAPSPLGVITQAANSTPFLKFNGS